MDALHQRPPTWGILAIHEKVPRGGVSGGSGKTIVLKY
jgi:hypothetical protein